MEITLLQTAEVAVTGTDPLVFKQDGLTIPNGRHFVCVTDLSPLLRKQITLKSRPATIDPKTNRFSKEKRSVSIAFPHSLGDGTVVYNTIRVETEIHPETDVTTRKSIRECGAQIVSEADLGDFWNLGAY